MFESSHNIATWYHPIITLLNLLNLLPCRVLVKKSSKMLLVGQCLTLIFSCFTLLFTQKNLIPMCLYFLEHGFFHYLPFSLLLRYLATKCSISLVTPSLPRSIHTKSCMVDNGCFLLPPMHLNFSSSFYVYLTEPSKPLYQKYLPLLCVPSCPCAQHEINQHMFVFMLVIYADDPLVINFLIPETQDPL